MVLRFRPSIAALLVTFNVNAAEYPERPVGSSSADLDKLLRSELALWSKVIRDIGIKPAE
jgi:hypothetical protein